MFMALARSQEPPAPMLAASTFEDLNAPDLFDAPTETEQENCLGKIHPCLLHVPICFCFFL